MRKIKLRREYQIFLRKEERYYFSIAKPFDYEHS